MPLKFFRWEPNSFTQTNGWTDGHTDVPKLIVYFRKIENAPKNGNTAKMLTIIFMIDSVAYLGRNNVGDLVRQPLNIYLYFGRPIYEMCDVVRFTVTKLSEKYPATISSRRL
jgi:hypothetical protein